MISNLVRSKVSPPREPLGAMLVAPTRSRCATKAQVGHRNVRPLGLETLAPHRGQVELVPRSSTNSTSIPAGAALSDKAAII